MPLSNDLVYTPQIIDHLLLGQTLKKKSFHFIKNVIYIYMSVVDLKNQTGVIHFILTVHEVGFDIYCIYVSLRCWSQYTPPVVFPRNITKCTCFAKVVVVHSINLLMTN